MVGIGHHHHHGLKKQQYFCFITQKVGGLGGEGGCGKDTGYHHRLIVVYNSSKPPSFVTQKRGGMWGWSRVFMGDPNYKYR